MINLREIEENIIDIEYHVFEKDKTVVCRALHTTYLSGVGMCVPERNEKNGIDDFNLDSCKEKARSNAIKEIEKMLELYCYVAQRFQ